MPRRDQRQVVRKSTKSSNTAKSEKDSAFATEMPCEQVEQLSKLAMFIAIGQVEMPLNLPNDKMMTVTFLVRERRRENLLGHIARCIAADIFLNECQLEGETDD